MADVKLTAHFGDMVENGWASEANPTRRGYFVREGRRTGKMNPGRYWEITDRKGKFWELMPYGDHKITVTSSHEGADAVQAGGMPDLTRPIIGIENRSALEVFDIMSDRIRGHRPVISDAMVERGAVGLVAHAYAGRQPTDWAKKPKSWKKNHMDMARAVLEAALQPGGGEKTREVSP